MATTASVSCWEWTRLLWTSAMLTKRESPGETAHWLLCEYCLSVTQATFRDTFQMATAGTVGDKSCVPSWKTADYWVSG